MQNSAGKNIPVHWLIAKSYSYIRNLFKNEDYVELEKAFAGYTRMNDRCLKYEEAFETDPEVFDLYLKYLEKNRKGSRIWRR